MDKTTAHAQGFRDLPDGLPLRTKSLEPGGIYGDGLATYSKPFGSTVGNSSLNPLTDQVTLEFREAGDHVEHESTGWRGQIEAVTQAHKGNAEGFKFTESRNQVFE